MLLSHKYGEKLCELKQQHIKVNQLDSHREVQVYIVKHFSSRFYQQQETGQPRIVSVY